MGGGAGAGGDDVFLVRQQAQERAQLELTLAGQKARLAVLQAEADRQTAATGGANGAGAGAGAGAGTSSTAWAQVIEARQKAVQAARAVNSSGKEIAEAEARLAEAQAMAAPFGQRQAGAAAAGSPFDAADRLRSDLVTLKASIAEAEARLNLMNERAAKVAGSATAGAGGATTTQPASPQEIDRLQRDEQRARQEVDELTMQLDQLKRDRRNNGGGVRLLVLDGRPDKQPAQ
jgi:hypothetical protein